MLATGFRNYERIRMRLPGDGAAAPELMRDVLRVGRVAALLPIDPVRRELVVLRQFRLPAHLANGKGNLIEIVAGRVEKGEKPAETARRECIEEIGVEPDRVIELFSYLSTPGICDEEFTVFLGSIDASRVPKRAGAAAENEVTRPRRIAIDAAIAALDSGRLRSGPLIIALQWLALHHDRLDRMLRTGAARR
jgi:ADP-ribose pyrophosphatase